MVVEHKELIEEAKIKTPFNFYCKEYVEVDEVQDL